MAKRGRPAQGINSTKPIVKRPAGGTNDRIVGTSSKRNNKKRGFAS
jgi:hypothetical protein